MAGLTDGACSGSACAAAVNAILLELSHALHTRLSGSATLQQVAQQPPGAPEVATFLRLLECVQQATAYIAGCTATPVSHRVLCAQQ